ncbi:XRE family transcriptional regulator [Sebaldella sp. S0638]|uniref:XRE family transcriptional regulator n=1 Tax=Sebaldella sp. S0638 TaxID=2957809 RepID=UPI00209DFC31|nr:XRE family transcriptional regulator [Sebaldella sp. S0638]MCP1226638.1 LexA family transcriptional regulator [Sebaldella sp. S0638]
MENKINEYVKEIRVNEGYTLQELADKLDVSKNFVHMIEKEERNVTEKFLKKLVNALPKYREKLLNIYYKDKIPSDFWGNNIKRMRLQVYDYDTSLDGRVCLTNSKEVVFVSDKQFPEKSIFINVSGEKAEPFFYSGDLLVFYPEKFQNWESLNRCLVAVKMKGEIVIRKLIFKEAVPFLVAFNNEVYPDIDIKNEKIEYLGQLSEFLERSNARGMKF